LLPAFAVVRQVFFDFIEVVLEARDLPRSGKVEGAPSGDRLGFVEDILA
jgi:hypothetical protein